MAYRAPFQDRVDEMSRIKGRHTREQIIHGITGDPKKGEYDPSKYNMAASYADKKVMYDDDSEASARIINYNRFIDAIKKKRQAGQVAQGGARGMLTRGGAPAKGQAGGLNDKARSDLLTKLMGAYEKDKSDFVFDKKNEGKEYSTTFEQFVTDQFGPVGAMVGIGSGSSAEDDFLNGPVKGADSLYRSMEGQGRGRYVIPETKRADGTVVPSKTVVMGNNGGKADFDTATGSMGTSRGFGAIKGGSNEWGQQGAPKTLVEKVGLPADADQLMVSSHGGKGSPGTPTVANPKARASVIGGGAWPKPPLKPAYSIYAPGTPTAKAQQKQSDMISGVWQGYANFADKYFGGAGARKLLAPLVSAGRRVKDDFVNQRKGMVRKRKQRSMSAGN